MKQYVNKNKKTTLALCLAAALTATAFAQEANDGFVVPLDEDFTASVSAAPAGPAAESTGGGTTSSVKQGAWIELTSSNQAIIRDLATHEDGGYELDNAHLLSKLNWWFWGDITPMFQLNAEIGVYNFDKTLYQSNSYADNDPTVSWKDGWHEVYSMPFSFMRNGNDGNIGTFNKMGFTIISPWVETKIGYGDLKEAGMLDFNGIYHVIDRWDNVGDGFTELSLGKDLRTYGDFTVNATAALSMMRSTYGMYDLLDVKYGDASAPLAELVATFGSLTGSEKLYDYSKNNSNAVSAYLAVAPLEPLKIEFHALGSFGTDNKLKKESLALAGRVGWIADLWSARVMESYAGKDVNSVWGTATGTETQDYDNIRVGKSYTQIDLAVTPLSYLTVGLDEGIALPSYDEENFTLSYASSTSAEWSVRSQPFFDLDFSSFTDLPLSLGAYAVLYTDKAVSGKKSETITSLQEAGTEILWLPDFELLKRLRFDYALSNKYAKWTSSQGSSYTKSKTFHSVILTGDITDNFNVFGGMLYCKKETTADSDQPLGFALGFALNKTPLPGHPKLWAHFTYGMDPFEDNNYSLYRADDKTQLHRTYLLNTLDVEEKGTSLQYKSFIRVGLIWDL